VDGCLAGLSRYYANGNRLLQPRKVMQATANLRTVSDTVGLFLANECVLEPRVKISRSDLRGMLVKWCEEEGVHRVPSARKLATALQDRGVVDGGKTMYDRLWSGIRFKNELERDAYDLAQSAQRTLVWV